MSMHFSDITAQAASDGRISAEEILELRRAGWADGHMDPDEAESLFSANERLAEPSADWCDFFVEALTEFIVNTVEPYGHVDDIMAEELIARIDRDGRVGTMAELELLVRVFEKAASVPRALKTYALRQVEEAVLNGDGPTRHGRLDPEGVNDAECALLRRLIFAPASDRPAAVSQAEAEALFRIKDATLYERNAPEWERLFVQGVANYLLGFDTGEELSPARARELEAFMTSDGAGIGGFLHRMMTADVESGFGSLLALSPGAPGPEDEDVAVDTREGEWLQDLLEADEELDPMEKALIAFIAEETGEVFGLKV